MKLLKDKSLDELRKDAKKELMEKYGLSEKDAEEILNCIETVAKNLAEKTLNQ